MSTPYKPHVKVTTPNPIHVAELAKAFEHMRNKYIKKGTTYNVTDKPMNGYRAMQAQYDTTNHITVSSEGCDTAIYGTVPNIAFRFWHDCVHCELRQDFSYHGEQAVILYQWDELKAYGISDGALAIFEADTIGQVCYYYKHKEFVKDQARFITACLTQGIVAVSIKQ